MLIAVQRKMVGHAALILLIAMLAGIGLLIALLGGLELIPGQILPIDIVGNPQTWARIHIGGILNALLIFVVALLLPMLAFSEKAERRIAWAMIGTGWANSLFYWAALFAPNRALTIGPNKYGQSNLAAIIGLTPALVFVIVSSIVVSAIAARAFSAPAK